MPVTFNFLLLLTLLNNIVVRAANIVLVLYALKLGAEPVTVGLLAATFSFLPMLVSMPAGKLADRYGALWPLVIGTVGGGLGLLVPYLVPGLAALFVAATLMGLTSSMHTLLQNMAGLLSPPQTRVRNFSNFSMIMAASSFIGPLIGGFAIDHYDHATACLQLALLMLAPVAMLIVRSHAFPRGTPQVKHEGGDTRSLLADPGVRRMLATSSLLNTGNDLYLFYMPVYANSLGFSATTIGLVLAMFSAAAFVIRIVLPRLILRFREEKLLAIALYVSALSLLLIPFTQSAVVLMAISFVFGLGPGAGQPIITMLMFIQSPQGRSGEGLGLRMSVVFFTKLVGPLVFGAIGQVLGLPPMFWINSAMLAGGGLLSRAAKKPAARS